MAGTEAGGCMNIKAAQEASGSGSANGCSDFN